MTGALAAFVGPGVPPGFDEVVQRHLDGIASETELAVLEAHRDAWIRLLLRSFDDIDLTIGDLQHRLRGAERSMAIADFEREVKRIDEVLAHLIGTAEPTNDEEEPVSRRSPAPAVVASLIGSSPGPAATTHRPRASRICRTGWPVPGVRRISGNPIKQRNCQTGRVPRRSAHRSGQCSVGS